MEALLIQPENSEQLAAVKAVLKALKVPYKRQTEETFPPVKRADINQAYEEMRQGNYEAVGIDDLWK